MLLQGRSVEFSLLTDEPVEPRNPIFAHRRAADLRNSLFSLGRSVKSGNSVFI